MLWRYFFVLFVAFGLAACAASWDVGKGNVEVTRKGGEGV